MINNIKKFLKANKIISFVAFISTAIIFVQTKAKDVPEWFPHAENWFNVFFQLAIGFDINFIFYITQVYIPRLKQNKTVYECIYERINKLESHMNKIFVYIAQLYVQDYKDGMELTPKQLAMMLGKLNFDDKVHFINPRKAYSADECFSVKELMLTQIQWVENDIDKLYSYYALYVSPELMEVLEDILNSSMHVIMGKIIVHMPKDYTFEENCCDIFFTPYYNLMHELTKVKNMYKD